MPLAHFTFVHTIIMLPTHIAELLTNVHCVVAKDNIVQLMGGICL